MRTQDRTLWIHILINTIKVQLILTYFFCLRRINCPNAFALDKSRLVIMDDTRVLRYLVFLRGMLNKMIEPLPCFMKIQLRHGNQSVQMARKGAKKPALQKPQLWTYYMGRIHYSISLIQK